MPISDGRKDLGQLLVDGLAVVVQGRSLEDDGGRAHQDGQGEDPEKEAIQNHGHILPILAHLSDQESTEKRERKCVSRHKDESQPAGRESGNSWAHLKTTVCAIFFVVVPHLITFLFVLAAGGIKVLAGRPARIEREKFSFYFVRDYRATGIKKDQLTGDINCSSREEEEDFEREEAILASVYLLFKILFQKYFGEITISVATGI